MLLEPLLPAPARLGRPRKYPVRCLVDGVRHRTRPQRVLADKAYSSRANRARRGSRGGRPPAFDPETYKDRHAVERGFNHLKHHRGFATRYDKLAVRYTATINIASIDHWLRRLS